MNDNFWVSALPFIKWTLVIVSGLFAIYGIYVERRTRSGNINQAGRHLLPWVILLGVLGIASHLGENELQRIEDTKKAKAHEELLTEIRSGVYSLQPNSGLLLSYGINLSLNDPVLHAYRNRLLIEVAAHSNASIAKIILTNSSPILSYDTGTRAMKVQGIRFNGKSLLHPGGSPEDGKHAADIFQRLGLYGSFSKGLTNVPSEGNYPPDANIKFFTPVNADNVGFEFHSDSGALDISIKDISLPSLKTWRSDGKVGSLVDLQRCLFFCRFEWRPSDEVDFFDEEGGRISNRLQLSAVGFHLAGLQLDCLQLTPLTNRGDNAFYQTLTESIRGIGL